MIKIYRTVLELETGQVYTYYRELVQTTMGERWVEGMTVLSEDTAPMNVDTWGNDELKATLATHLAVPVEDFEVLKMPAKLEISPLPVEELPIEKLPVGLPVEQPVVTPEPSPVEQPVVTPEPSPEVVTLPVDAPKDAPIEEIVP